MKTKHLYILLGIALLVTLYGVITGKFFFLFLILPFGLGLFNRKKDED